jgi:hypothetical protein
MDSINLSTSILSKEKGVHCRWLFPHGCEGGFGEGETPSQRKINDLAGAKFF